MKNWKLSLSIPVTLVVALIAVALVQTANTTFAYTAGDSPTYVGSKTCKKCHIKQHKSWEKTKMGQTFEVLKPGQNGEKKTEAKLDPAKDYTTDVTCLKCHVVGFGTESGYKIPPPDDKKALRKAKNMMGVGCESCHGPGSEYVKLHKEIQDNKRKYKVDEMYAAGMTKISPEVCAKCHTEESPFVGEGYVFDFEKRKDEGTHEHFPLQYREE
jgi:hypothetical protein